MTINVTIQEADNEQEFVIGHIFIIDRLQMHMEELTNLRLYTKAFGTGYWLSEATIHVASMMDNCTKKIIRELEAEIRRSTLLLKEHFPTRYKIEYYKVIIKNPLKTLLAKWLL